MSEYKAIETTDLVKIANAIRLKKGGTDKISLEDMPAMIREIEGGGVKLPALTNEAAASELLAGKQLINDEGNVITGAMADNGTIASTMDGLNIKEVTIPAGYTSGGIVSLDNTIDNEVDIQANLLAQAVAALEGKAGGGSEPSLQSKSVTPSAVQQTVVPDSGYDGLDKVTVAAIPTATQATPSISVNSSGLITASATQSAGYVSAGTKSATKQLTTQAAKTITPSTSQQTAVAKGVYTTGAVTVAAIPSTYVKPTATKAATTYTPTASNQTIAAGTYCSGAQTIKGDANLVAGNIKSGVSIFGVAGNYAGSGGGDTSMEDGLVTRTGSVYVNDRVTTIGGYAFQHCSRLTTVSFPNATSIGTYAFNYCYKLTTASFPKAKSIGSYAFTSCSSLTTASFPSATSIGSYAFNYCYNLKSLYLTGSSVCKLSASNAFTSTPIGGYSTSARTYGSIYVPTSLLTSYKTATNWTYFSSRFVGI